MKPNIKFLIFMICVISGSALINLMLTIPTAKSTPAKDDDITLKEYFDVRISALEQNMIIQFKNDDGKLNAINQSIINLSMDIGKLATKDDVKNNTADIQDLRESRANQEGKASMGSVYFAYGLSVLGIGIAALSLRRKFNVK